MPPKLLPFSMPSTLLLLGTTRLECFTPKGLVTGTGFFVNLEMAGKETTFLVTAKHVVEDAVFIKCTLHVATGQKDAFDLASPVIKECLPKLTHWVLHSTQDVAMVDFTETRLRLHADGKTPQYLTFTRAQIPNEEELITFSAAHGVVMPGYPNGLCDETHGLPLLRRGVTASHPVVDFEGSPQGVVDVAVFKGSSGSPVCIIDEVIHSTPSGIKMGHRIRLLGILYAGPDYRGEIEQTAATKGSVALLPMHLGYYVKVLILDELLAIAESRLGASAAPIGIPNVPGLTCPPSFELASDVYKTQLSTSGHTQYESNTTTLYFHSSSPQLHDFVTATGWMGRAHS